MNSDSLASLLAFVFLFLIFASIYRRREAIRYFLRRMVVTGITFFGVFAYMQQAGRSQLETVTVTVLSTLAVNSLMPKRGRYIHRSEKRRAIARWELETGQKFNPKIHELDHQIPFAQGGGSTEENLRVLTRRANRSKGARSPWWDLLSR